MKQLWNFLIKFDCLPKTREKSNNLISKKKNFYFFFHYSHSPPLPSFVIIIQILGFQTCFRSIKPELRIFAFIWFIMQLVRWHANCKYLSDMFHNLHILRKIMSLAWWREGQKSGYIFFSSLTSSCGKWQCFRKIAWIKAWNLSIFENHNNSILLICFSLVLL